MQVSSYVYVHIVTSKIVLLVCVVDYNICCAPMYYTPMSCFLVFWVVSIFVVGFDGERKWRCNYNCEME